MGLEKSNSSQPPEPGPQPDSNSLSSDAPLATSLPSMMTSLTPHAPATSGDSTPQYPSLEAAVGIEPQVAPTLTNLLAAKTQKPSNLGLGTPGIAVAAATAVSMGSQANSQTSNEPEQPSNSNPANAMTAESSPEPSAPSLKDEQGPLAGQAIAVQQPGSEQVSPAPVSDIAQNNDAKPDASWDAIAESNEPVTTPSEPSIYETAERASNPSLEPSEEIPSASQEGAVSADLAEETEVESEAELSPVQTTNAPDEISEGTGRDENEARETQPEDDQPSNDDNDNFDQVKEQGGESDRAQQVLIKREDAHVAIVFPEEEASANPDVAVDFIDSQLWQDLQQRLSGGTAFASNTPVHLYSQNCLLDTRQLQELDEALGRFNLKLARIITSRRQTAVAAAMSGYSADQTNNLPELLSKEVYSPQKIGLAEPLYLQKNIRSGTEIRHPGSVIVMGDLNPGSSVIADGDILVWGRLRGIAHAGAAGNKTSIVMALKLEAPQIRIAGAVARVDAQDKGNPTPEVAYINDKAIRITSAYGFNRNELS